jgi:hypothetical protein
MKPIIPKLSLEDMRPSSLYTKNRAEQEYTQATVEWCSNLLLSRIDQRLNTNTLPLANTELSYLLSPQTIKHIRWLHNPKNGPDSPHIIYGGVQSLQYPNEEKLTDFYALIEQHIKNNPTEKNTPPSHYHGYFQLYTAHHWVVLVVKLSYSHQTQEYTQGNVELYNPMIASLDPRSFDDLKKNDSKLLNCIKRLSPLADKMKIFNTHRFKRVQNNDVTNCGPFSVEILRQLINTELFFTPCHITPNGSLLRAEQMAWMQEHQRTDLISSLQQTQSDRNIGIQCQENTRKEEYNAVKKHETSMISTIEEITSLPCYWDIVDCWLEINDPSIDPFTARCMPDLKKLLLPREKFVGNILMQTQEKDGSIDYTFNNNTEGPDHQIYFIMLMEHYEKIIQAFKTILLSSLSQNSMPIQTDKEKLSHPLSQLLPTHTHVIKHLKKAISHGLKDHINTSLSKSDLSLDQCFFYLALFTQFDAVRSNQEQESIFKHFKNTLLQLPELSNINNLLKQALNLNQETVDLINNLTFKHFLNHVHHCKADAVRNMYSNSYYPQSYTYTALTKVIRDQNIAARSNVQKTLALQDIRKLSLSPDANLYLQNLHKTFIKYEHTPRLHDELNQQLNHDIDTLEKQENNNKLLQKLLKRLQGFQLTYHFDSTLSLPLTVFYSVGAYYGLLEFCQQLDSQRQFIYKHEVEKLTKEIIKQFPSQSKHPKLNPFEILLSNYLKNNHTYTHTDTLKAEIESHPELKRIPLEFLLLDGTGKPASSFPLSRQQLYNELIDQHYNHIYNSISTWDRHYRTIESLIKDYQYTPNYQIILHQLNQIIGKFPDENTFVTARNMIEEHKTPPKTLRQILLNINAYYNLQSQTAELIFEPLSPSKEDTQNIQEAFNRNHPEHKEKGYRFFSWLSLYYIFQKFIPAKQKTLTTCLSFAHSLSQNIEAYLNKTERSSEFNIMLYSITDLIGMGHNVHKMLIISTLFSSFSTNDENYNNTIIQGNITIPLRKVFTCTYLWLANNTNKAPDTEFQTELFFNYTPEKFKQFATAIEQTQIANYNVFTAEFVLYLCNQPKVIEIFKHVYELLSQLENTLQKGTQDLTITRSSATGCADDSNSNSSMSSFVDDLTSEEPPLPSFFSNMSLNPRDERENIPPLMNGNSFSPIRDGP